MLSFLKGLFQKSNEGLEQAFQKGAVIVDVRTKSEYQQGTCSRFKEYTS